jgi:hypothetical protein
MCTDKRLLTVDFKRSKVMKINQVCEVTDCDQLYAQNNNKSLGKSFSVPLNLNFFKKQEALCSLLEKAFQCL